MKGKQRCKILKQIRKEIADANGIEYAISECPHKGDCAGTCPKCESELAYLERELEKRRQTGKKVAIAGIAAAAVISSAACRKEGMRPGNDDSGLAGDLSIPVTSDTKDTGELILQGGLIPPPVGRIDGIYSGSPRSDGADVPTIDAVIYISPEDIRDKLSGFRFDEVAEAWKQYVCKCDVENGAGYLYDGYSIHLYKNAEGYVDAIEVTLD